MSNPSQPARHSRAHAAMPRWLLVALPLAIIGGIALALTSTSVPAVFGPRRGPPDTLAVTRIAAPRTPSLLQARYLERALAAKSARETRITTLADRYHVTLPLARLIHDVAIAEGIDPELAFRLIRVESRFEADVIGMGGALGLMQLMWGTAQDLDPTIQTRQQVLDPRTNLRLGLTNLRDMIERYGGDVRLGVIAYNRGERAVDRAIREGKDPENGYGVRVLGPVRHGGRAYAGTGLLPRPAAPVAPAQ